MCVFRRGDIYHYDFVANGKRYRGSTGQTNEKKAKIFENIKRAEAINGGLPNRRTPTLREFSKYFLRFVDESKLDDDTKRYYRNGWRMIEATKLSNMRISQVTHDEVEALGPDSGSGSNINCARRTIRRMLAKAVEKKVIPFAPKIHLVEEHAREQTFDLEQQEEFLKLAEQPLKDVAMLIFDCGMRPDEVYRMRIENVDHVKKRIFIPDGKTPNARRFVPLSERCSNAILIRVAQNKRDKKLKDSPFVFASKRSASGHLSPNPCNRQFARCREKMGLGKEYVLYTARHTFGTEVMDKTKNPKLVMKVLGHSDLKTTARYVHPETEIVREIIDQRNGVVVQ